MSEFLAAQEEGGEEKLRSLDDSDHAARLQRLAWRVKPPGLETLVRFALGGLRRYEIKALEYLREEAQRWREDLQVERHQHDDLVARVEVFRRHLQENELQPEERVQLESQLGVLLSEAAECDAYRAARAALPGVMVDPWLGGWTDAWVRRWRKAGAPDEEILSHARSAFSGVYTEAPKVQSFLLESEAGGALRVTIPGPRLTLPYVGDECQGPVYLAMSDREDAERMELAFGGWRKSFITPITPWQAAGRGYFRAKSVDLVNSAELARDLGPDWGVVCAAAPPG